jgi:hypothetical protein
MSLAPGTRCRQLFTVDFDSGQKLILFAHEIEPASDDLAA